MIPLLGITGLYLTLGLRGFTIFNLKNAFILLIENNKPGKDGISPFQALMTAQAASVGTGNIIGVAAAIALGGPGAVFWMWIIAILGMSTVLEAFLAVMYSEKNRRGAKVGGPMYYIKNGLGRLELVSISFCILRNGCFFWNRKHSAGKCYSINCV